MRNNSLPVTVAERERKRDTELSTEIRAIKFRTKMAMATMSLGKLLFIILVAKSLIFAEALKCYQCGQYNDGVGSITPCLNYTEQTEPFYLKDCPRSSDAYCIVSEKK